LWQAQQRLELITGLGLGAESQEQQQKLHAVSGDEHVALDGSAQFLRENNHTNPSYYIAL